MSSTRDLEMAFTKKVILAFAIVCLVSVHGYKEELRRTMQGCKNGKEVTEEEIEEFEKPLIPKTEEEKCLMACVFRNFNVIENGTFDQKLALIVIKDILKDHPEKQKKIQSVIDHCGHEIPAKMDNECELASEIMNCYVKWEKEVGIY